MTKSEQMIAQESAAESALRAADKCLAVGNLANARHFHNLAAAHLGEAARLVPCVRGVPTDPEARQRIGAAHREVLNRLMADARRGFAEMMSNG